MPESRTSVDLSNVDGDTNTTDLLDSHLFSYSTAKVLTLNGTIFENSNGKYKPKWASGGGLADRREAADLISILHSPLRSYSRDDRGPEYSIFIGDLGPEANDFVFVSLFQSRFAWFTR